MSARHVHSERLHVEQIASGGQAHFGTRPWCRATFSYDADRPWEVACVFFGGDAMEVGWIFSRELLVAGLASPTPVGEGDVKIDSDVEKMRLHLYGWDGDDRPTEWLTVVLEMPREGVDQFVRDTYRLVPDGLEVDPAIDRLINSINE